MAQDGRMDHLFAVIFKQLIFLSIHGRVVMFIFIVIRMSPTFLRNVLDLLFSFL